MKSPGAVLLSECRAAVAGERRRESSRPTYGRAGLGPERGVGKYAPRETKEFDNFWAAYPRKESMPDARKAWNAEVQDPAAVMAALAVALKGWSSSRPQMIPFPATWLRRREWENPDYGKGKARVNEWAGYR